MHFFLYWLYSLRDLEDFSPLGELPASIGLVFKNLLVQFEDSLNYHVVYPREQVQIWRCSVDPGDPLADFTAVEALERWLLAKAGSWEPWEVSDLKTQERQNPKSEAVPGGR